MSKVAIKQEVLNLQAKLALVRERLEEQPDVLIDEKNWKNIKTASKRSRRKVFAMKYGKT